MNKVVAYFLAAIALVIIWIYAVPSLHDPFQMIARLAIVIGAIVFVLLNL